MPLLALKKAAPPPPSVKFMLHRAMAGMEDARAHFPLRASDTTNKTHEFCPREHALLDMGLGSKKDQFVGTSQRYTYNHGKDSERRIQNDYLRPQAVGRWRCMACKTLHPDIGKAPKVPCDCGVNLWRYDEIRFTSKYSGISGGTDLLLDVGRPKLRMVELKTMAPEEFKTLAAPLAEHKVRTSLYLNLISEDGNILKDRVDTSEASILYASKGYGVKDETIKAAGIKDMNMSPFKEFIIKRDDSLVGTIINKARTLKLWREDKSIGLPGGICSLGSKRSNACGVCGPCFSGKYPAQITWIEQGALAGTPRHPTLKVVQ